MSEQRPRVFVVDDENVTAATLATILNQSGFNSTAYTNAIEALNAAETERPDLLVSDVVMPQMTGIDLAIRLQALRPGCKVLLFSGKAETAELLRTARQRGHDFALLSKPVHPGDLLAALRTL